MALSFLMISQLSDKEEIIKKQIATPKTCNIMLTRNPEMIDITYVHEGIKADINKVINFAEFSLMLLNQHKTLLNKATINFEDKFRQIGEVVNMHEGAKDKKCISNTHEPISWNWHKMQENHQLFIPHRKSMPPSHEAQLLLSANLIKINQLKVTNPASLLTYTKFYSLTQN